jgi:glucose uptake protein
VPVLVILSTAWGLTVFGENPNGPLLVLALLAVLGAAFCMILSSEDETMVRHRVRGYLLAAVLGVCHGSYFVPLQNSDVPIQTILLPVAIGMVLTMSLIIIASRAKVWFGAMATTRMTLAGIILGGGNYFALATMSELGVSLGYPLTQLGIVVNTLWGVFLFHEVTTRRGKVLVVLGVGAALIGAILANYART